MAILRYSKSIYTAAVLAAAVVTVSCIKKEVEEPAPGPQDGKVRIELFTNAAEYSAPVSRADESGLTHAPMVLVYRGTTTSAVFTEAALSTYQGGTTSVALTPSAAASQFVVIDNYPATLGDGTPFTVDGLTTLLTGTTLADLESKLITPALSNTQTTNPYGGTTDLIPMAGLSNSVTDVSENTKIYNDIGDTHIMRLRRCVAKAYVETTLAGFTVVGLGAVNVADRGSLFTTEPAAVNYTGYTRINYSDGTDIILTGGGPLFLYETSASHQPGLILKATLDSRTYYYKLGFAVNDTYMAVLRNKTYTFTVTAAGPGYATLAEALTAPPSNIEYEIKVTDDTAHDMVSNGQYYLGLSNSGVMVWGNRTTLTEAFVVTTDATSAMGLTARMTASAGLTLSTGTIALNGVPTPVTVEMAAATTNGTVTIELGNLTQTVVFERYGSVHFAGMGREIDGGDYVHCEVPAGNNWLKVSSNASDPIGDEVTLPTPGKMYIIPDLNSASAAREGELFAVRATGAAGHQRRFKVFLGQEGYDLEAVPEGRNGSVDHYVAAFWRKDQTGERLIRVPWKILTGMEGKWVAMTTDDWVVLDTEPSADPGVTWDAATENPADMIANDALYQVGGTAKMVRGELKAAVGEYIYFRIGLTGKHTATAAQPARYGKVQLIYADGQRYVTIYLRQGEDPDYLMRPEDSDGTGTVTTEWGGTAATPRPMAVKWVPFNLSTREFMAGSTADFIQLNNRAGTASGNHGIFADYPSQAGGFFKWAAPAGEERYAYNPVIENPLGATYGSGLWKALKDENETCPPGYRRPNDGSESAYNTTGPIAGSEVRQSLFLNPFSGQTSQPLPDHNISRGYMADGYFDRRQILPSCKSKLADTAVEPNSSRVGYTGHVYYNPYSGANFFWSASGYRAFTGIIDDGLSPGTWTSSTNYSNTAWGTYPDYSNVICWCGGRYLANPIRCVVEE